MRSMSIESLEKKIAAAEDFVKRAEKKKEQLKKWREQLAEKKSPAYGKKLDTEEARLLAQLEKVRAAKAERASEEAPEHAETEDS